MKGSEILTLVTEFLAREQRVTDTAIHGALGIPPALLQPALDYLVDTGRVAKIKALAQSGDELDDYGMPMAGPQAGCGTSCNSCGSGNFGTEAAEVWIWKG